MEMMLSEVGVSVGLVVVTKIVPNIDFNVG